MKLGLPGDRLFEMMMLAGPLPERHHLAVGGRLSGSIMLDYTAEELLAMRRWFLSVKPHEVPDEQRARDACANAIRIVLRDARRCPHCGGELKPEGDARLRCSSCGALE